MREIRGLATPTTKKLAKIVGIDGAEALLVGAPPPPAAAVVPASTTTRAIGISSVIATCPRSETAIERRAGRQHPGPTKLRPTATRDHGPRGAETLHQRLRLAQCRIGSISRWHPSPRRRRPRRPPRGRMRMCAAIGWNRLCGISSIRASRDRKDSAH